MSDLVEFLLARIADDEAVAQEAADRCPLCGLPKAVCRDPARVLAECEAKRRIVLMVNWYGYDPDAKPQRRDRHRADTVLCALALPYADHPDYREEWRP